MIKSLFLKLSFNVKIYFLRFYEYFIKFHAALVCHTWLRVTKHQIASQKHTNRFEIKHQIGKMRPFLSVLCPFFKINVISYLTHGVSIDVAYHGPLSFPVCAILLHCSRFKTAHCRILSLHCSRGLPLPRLPSSMCHISYLYVTSKIV